jgi:hypothetical protein
MPNNLDSTSWFKLDSVELAAFEQMDISDAHWDPEVVGFF